MIVLVTDFGLEGPYTGLVRAVLAREAPGIPVVDLFSDLPAFRPQAAAYLLAAYVSEFPVETVFVVVVDPGVGTNRAGVVVQADGRWFVGPDNGLFRVVARRARTLRRWVLHFQGKRLSATFHGRDVFAPVAAAIAAGRPVPGEPAPPDTGPWCNWPDELFEVVYIDRYGNAMTGVRASAVAPTTVLGLGDAWFEHQRTFGDAVSGQPFWLANSCGLVELALREDSVARCLGLGVGDRLRVLR